MGLRDRGAWEATATDHHGTEFILLSPDEDPRHVELLSMVANLHADPRFPLKVGSTVEIGRPWMDGSAADRLLVSLPYPFGPALEHGDLGERHIRFLWLVPITPTEDELIRTDGLEALEQLFEQANVDMSDPRRPSLA